MFSVASSCQKCPGFQESLQHAALDVFPEVMTCDHGMTMSEESICSATILPATVLYCNAHTTSKRIVLHLERSSGFYGMLPRSRSSPPK
jgi:hypothetical protein